MTSPDHPSGTDRLAEVALNFPDVDVIVNVQGDEPMIPPEIIDRLAKAFEAESDLKMATMKVLMREEDYNNPAAVKVVTDNNGYALYFSRSLMPYPRNKTCLLYTSDAADDLLCVDIGGRRIIKKKTHY